MTGTDGRHGGDTESVYQALRPLLFSIAYRMLSSVSEAEDVVQEAFLRYHRIVAGQDAARLAEGVPVRGGHPAVHRPAAVGESPA